MPTSILLAPETEQRLDFLASQTGRKIPIRCFSQVPSVSSSLKFLRKTPWAREKVESLYLFVLREQARRGPLTVNQGQNNSK